MNQAPKAQAVASFSSRTSGLTPDEQTISAYATTASSIVDCSYSDGLR
jgi:hypothetical protein